jgi:uncharacterized protein (DUF2141 family)
MKTIIAAPFLWAALAAQTAPPSLEVTLEGLRNQKGVVHLCLTRDAAHFPNCADDPQALKETVSAAAAGTLRITSFPAGTYAVSIFHDENRNGKLDTFVGIPREGFGFSRNPVVRFGPPQFERVRVVLAGGITRLTVRMQYLL